MRLEWLFQWWNAVYSVPLAFVLLFLTVSSLVGLVGGVFEGATHGHGDSDLDADVDVDLDADVDADVDVDTDADLAPNHAHPGSGTHSHHHGGPGPFLTLLAFLGVGKAPFMLTLQVLLLLWGLIGLGLHQLTAASPFSLVWSVPVTLVLSLVGTRAFATAFARTFRSFELPGVKRNDLVGRTGQVVYSVTADEGTVHVRDPHGALQRVRARCTHGALEPGRQIIVLGYDPERCLYEVDDASQFVDRK